MKKKSGILLIAAIILTSCNNNTEITGSWIQPVPGQEGNVQGFKLEDQGKASSINMHTLQYENWEKQGNHLILKGKSMGNGQTISFSDTLTIEKLSSDSLVLKNGEYHTFYTKLKGN